MKKNIYFLILLIPYWIFGQSFEHNILSQKLDSMQIAYSITGMQVVIVNKDSIQFIENYGNRVMSEQPITDESIFNVASITKTFTALGIMLLVEEGKINLEDKLKDIAPEIEFNNSWRETHPLQLVHLLEHTTGWRDVVLGGLATDRSNMSILEQANDQPKSRYCNYPPGQYHSYQNTNYSVAGYVIEKVSGIPYEDFIQQRILTPLGMEKSSLYPNDPYFAEHLAIDLGDKGPYRLIVDKPAAALFTSANEMSAYLRMYLNQGLLDSTRIAQASTIERMYTPSTSLASKAGNKLGYGLGINVEEWKGIKLFLHRGDQPYFTSLMVVLPQLEKAFFIGTNTTNRAVFPIAMEIMEVLKGMGLQEDVEHNISAEDDLLGFYRPINTANNIGTIAFFMSYIFTPIEIGKGEEGIYYKNYLSPQVRQVFKDGDNLFYFNSKRGLKNWVFKGENWKGESVLVDVASGLTFKKSSEFFVWGGFILFLFCVLFILSLPIITFFRWVWKYLFKKKVSFQWSLRMGLMAFLCLLIFITIMLLFSPESTTTIFEDWAAIKRLGSISWVSLSLYVLSLLFGLFSLGTVVLVFKNIKTLSSGGLKFYTLAVGLSLIVASIYLLNFGYIGFMSWNY